MKQILAILLLPLLLLSVNAWAAGSGAVGTPVAGSVILSIGHNEAQGADGSARVLSRQSEIYASDLIRTGARGQLQIRFSDGSRLSLKPNTEFRIEAYAFDRERPEEGKAFYQLLKGGMRTLSGQIGKADPENYRVDAVVATIGIRGTYYGLSLCDSQCAQRTGSEQGLAGEVLDGRIVVESATSRSEVGSDQFFFVASERPGEIDVVNEAPAALQSDSGSQASDEGSDEGAGESDSDDTSEAETDKAEGDSEAASVEPQSEVALTDEQVDGKADSSVVSDETATTEIVAKSGDMMVSTLSSSDPAVETTAIDAEKSLLTGTVQGSTSYTETAAPAGSLAAVAFISHDTTTTGYEGNGGSVEVAGSNSLKLATVNGVGNAVTGLYYVNPDQTQPDACNPCTFSARSAPLLSTGGDTVGLNWGRWGTGFYGEENGVPFSAVGSFHFIYSDKITDPATLANKTGSYTYNYMGGTPPQIEDGSLGKVDAAATYIQVDWSGQTVNAVSLGLNGFNDGRAITLSNMSTSIPLNDVVTGGRIDLMGTCIGGTCGSSVSMTGEMSLDFVGSSAERAISSFGANQDGVPSGVSVVGTAAFQ